MDPFLGENKNSWNHIYCHIWIPAWWCRMCKCKLDFSREYHWEECALYYFTEIYSIHIEFSQCYHLGTLWKILKAQFGKKSAKHWSTCTNRSSRCHYCRQVAATRLLGCHLPPLSGFSIAVDVFSSHGCRRQCSGEAWNSYWVCWLVIFRHIHQ
jgi:hypothetical protein